MDDVIKLAISAIGVIVVAPITAAFTAPKFWLGIIGSIDRMLSFVSVFALGTLVGACVVAVQIPDEVEVKFGASAFMITALLFNAAWMAVIAISYFIATKLIEFKD